MAACPCKVLRTACFRFTSVAATLVLLAVSPWLGPKLEIRSRYTTWERSRTVCCGIRALRTCTRASRATHVHACGACAACACVSPTTSHERTGAGSEFDSSRKRNTPFQFGIGMKEVVPGFEKAVIGMLVGEKKKTAFPPEVCCVCE